MIDLHLHSNYSDGSDTPEQLVAKAAAIGCEAIALTDHDTLRGIEEAIQAGEQHGIRVIGGVEFSASHNNRNCHLLGHFLQPGNQDLDAALNKQRNSRAARNERLHEKLHGLGVELSYDDVLAVAGEETVGRPHFAQIMLNAGYVDSIDEAFSRYLADGMPAHVQRDELSVKEVIALVHNAGGLVTWAHPLRQNETVNDIKSRAIELRDIGLDGLECYYSRYRPHVRDALVKLAHSLNLTPTGGSDYHGSYKPDLAIGSGEGDLEVPPSVLEALEKRLLA